MKRVALTIGLAIAAVALGACGSTEDRLKRIEVDGVDCIVATSPVGRPQALDCDFPAE